MIAAIAVMTQMTTTRADNNYEVQLYKGEVCARGYDEGWGWLIKWLLVAMMIGMLLMMILACLCYRRCHRKQKRTIATQSQITYTEVRGCLDPRFHPLADFQHGAFLMTAAD